MTDIEQSFRQEYKDLHSAGFMSNRGRQNVASYLALDLGLDWRKVLNLGPLSFSVHVHISFLLLGVVQVI